MGRHNKTLVRVRYRYTRMYVFVYIQRQNEQNVYIYTIYVYMRLLLTNSAKRTEIIIQDFMNVYYINILGIHIYYIIIYRYTENKYIYVEKQCRRWNVQLSSVLSRTYIRHKALGASCGSTIAHGYILYTLLL